MTETIEVRYRKITTLIVTAGGIPTTKDIYHKYIVYTNNEGEKFVGRGGPETYWDFGTESNSSDQVRGKHGSVGTIETYHGEWHGTLIDPVTGDPIPNSATVDWDSENDDPSETLRTDDDLSNEWEAIINELDAIDAEDYPYLLGGNNSNDVVDQALDAAGIPKPTLDDFDDNWSPQSGIPLFSLDPSDYVPDWVKDFIPSFGNAEAQASPLVIDLDGDGIELTAFNAETTTTFFDIDNDGYAEQSAWISPNQDGLLARDINQDGLINNAGELFGTATVDGFAVLAQLDSNGDLVIDQYDDAWDELVIWKDVDGDAYTDAGELLTLASQGITGISLTSVQASTAVIEGNPISHTGTVTICARGRSRLRERASPGFRPGRALVNRACAKLVPARRASIPDAGGQRRIAVNDNRVLPIEIAA